MTGVLLWLILCLIKAEYIAYKLQSFQVKTSTRVYSYGNVYFNFSHFSAYCKISDTKTYHPGKIANKWRLFGSL